MDESFRCMGSDVRLLADGDVDAAAPKAWLVAYAARLTRFDPRSELSALNHAPAGAVAASPLLRTAVQAGLWAASATSGLVDPTLIGAMERAGYAGSREGAVAVPLREALASAPPRRPARPDPAARWRSVAVDGEVVRRPSGVRFDTGGVGKGLAADALALRLAPSCDRLLVDCGGDMALRGTYEVHVAHPLTGECAHRLVVSGGGVATSGLNVRLWRRPDGSYAHHLIDPSTGEPAWTGLISATAVAPSALEAETLSKGALLGGPAAARRVLAEHGGGVIVHDDGDVEPIPAY
jgi:thiamine biosynthesis lipoprotein